MTISEEELHKLAVEATSADDVKTLEENAKSEKIARLFLTKSCPSFLESLDAANPSSTDRLVKAGRCIEASIKLATTPKENNATRVEKAKGALKLLVEECTTMAAILSGKETRKVPTVRYGKTELQMPIVTLGCMRFQQSWNRSGEPVTKIEQVEQACQDNLVDILKHAINTGVNHIETAQGYGCSEMQMGYAFEKLFKEKFCKREDLIIQTKHGVNLDMTIKSFKNKIITQLQRLKIKYVDLFSVHGLNNEDGLKALFDNDPEKGNLITALHELKAEGKIRHIGFSTHGSADLIQKAIETDAFAYLNLHHHFVGSYTASGDSDGKRHGNYANVELARSKDMGVFIISPYDKGGRVYAPSVKLRELTLPEFEPMSYGSLWLWQYHLHQKGAGSEPMIHTIVCGAARPSDLDQPVVASFQMIQDSPEAGQELLAKTVRVSDRLKQRMVDANPGGKPWIDTWHMGLPNWSKAKYGTQHGNMVWLYTIIHAYGLLDYAKERYSSLESRVEKWDDTKPKEENVTQFGAVWSWVPGIGFDASRDYTSDLENCPPDNQEKVKNAIAFVHKWCKKETEGEKLEIPFEWETSYDMRPWTAFPERS